jgi:uncharacterized membrane protein
MNEPYPDEEAKKDDSEVLNTEYSPRDDRTIIEASFRTGPIPDPITLEQYNRILPGAANRIVSMVEKEQEHRHRMQEKLIDAQVNDTKQERDERRLGQTFGLSIGVVSIVAGSITAILASPIAGGFIGSAGVVGLVSVFVLGRREQQNNKYPPQLESGDSEEDEADIN